MNAKTEATIQSVKELQNEINAWEGRLLGVKNDIQNLTAQKVKILKEIEDIKIAWSHEYEQKAGLLRQESAKLHEEMADLKAKREEIKLAASEVLRDRNSVEAQKSKAVDAETNFLAMNEKIGKFITLVRREAEKL